MSKKTVEVAAALIVKDSKVFACQRGYGEFKGMWEFPGGKIESGEDGRDAVIREIREELNIKIIPNELLLNIRYEYPDFHLDMECYLSEIASGDINLNEHTDSKWLSRDELDSVNWIPADIDAVNSLKTLL